MIKIFDSAAHPTISKYWTSTNNKKTKSSFEDLNKQMKKNNILNACAMGLENFEMYDHKKFMANCKKFKNLLPIAGINPYNKNISKELNFVKKLGYKGVKVHPRISKINLNSKKFVKFLKIIEKTKLVLMLCTYTHGKIGNNQEKDFLSILYKSFKGIKNLKTVLVHGGGVNLMNFSEFVRNNPNNFLLDLSMTMQKYKGSSLDNDIKYLFQNFDERLCIGSDYPEFSMKRLRSDFDYYSYKISNKKKNNIAHSNLKKFFNL